MNLARRTQCPARKRSVSEWSPVGGWRKRHYILRLNLLLYGHGQTEFAENLSPYSRSYKSPFQCLERNKRFRSAYKHYAKPKELTGTFNQLRKTWSLLGQGCPNCDTTSVSHICIPQNVRNSCGFSYVSYCDFYSSGTLTSTA